MNNSTSSVRVYKCSSWNDFSAKLRVIEGRQGTPWIYRGQAKIEWKLASLWERHIDEIRGGDKTKSVRTLFAPPETYEEVQLRFLENFKKRAIGLPGIQSASLKDDNDWWALGRHYGLLTPLLDWTASPYVAAFFAFTDYLEDMNPGFKQGKYRGLWRRKGPELGTGSVAVWALLLGWDLEQEDEFEVLSPQIDFSHYTNQMRAQRSIFTRVNHDVDLDLKSNLVRRNISHLLERFEIPVEEAGRALKSLEQMNITFSSMFPNLSGAAAHANIGTFHYAARD